MHTLLKRYSYIYFVVSFLSTTLWQENRICRKKHARKRLTPSLVVSKYPANASRSKRPNYSKPYRA